MTRLDASGIALTQAGACPDETGTSVGTVHRDVFERQPTSAPCELVVVANLHPGHETLSQMLPSAAGPLIVGGHLFIVVHGLTTLGRNGPPDPDRPLTVERLSQALPATVSVEALDQRRHRSDHGRAPTGKAPDPVAFCWTTRSVA